MFLACLASVHGAADTSGGGDQAAAKPAPAPATNGPVTTIQSSQITVGMQGANITITGTLLAPWYPPPPKQKQGYIAKVCGLVGICVQKSRSGQSAHT